MRIISTNVLRYFFVPVILGSSLVFPLHAQFVKGADVGWLSQMEATGYEFFDTTHIQEDCLDLLKERGINTLRFRLFVNPSADRINGHCSTREVVAMAQRAKDKGFRILLDLHYSDTWADPGHQSVPAAWANDSFPQLRTDLYQYTRHVIDTFCSLNLKPTWVQVGNEITNGMLWPMGSTSHWNQLSQLLTTGYQAVKAVDSSILVIIHHDNGSDTTACRMFYDSLARYHVPYDVIGLSYYPYWNGVDYTKTIQSLGVNLNALAGRFNKPVMIVETGGVYSDVQDTYNMLTALIQKLHDVPDNMGLGVIYWEPEGEKTWSGYNLSCWDSIGYWQGEPSRALYAFREDATAVATVHQSAFQVYPNPTSGRVQIRCPASLQRHCLVTLENEKGNVLKAGKPLSATGELDLSPLPPGIYILIITDKAFHTLSIKKISRL